MTRYSPLTVRCCAMLLVGALLLPAHAPAASDEVAILHEKVATLRGLPSASFEWQLLALDIARMLKALPASENRVRAARAFKSQVEGFVRRDVMANADQQLRTSTDAWASRVGSAFAAQGLTMQTRAREERGAWIASIDYRDMRESLAHKLSKETDLAATAQRAGFDRIEFVNSTTGKSWKFALDGGAQLRAKLMQDAAAEWGIDQL